MRNKVRIVGGTWRSRLIAFSPSGSLRPTPDRVRETLFNWLGQDLTGTRCLDLFAGSGALGFEAASRGAQHVVLVERARDAVLSLQANVKILQAQSVEVVRADALEFLAQDRRSYDVVFVDPPYALWEQARAAVTALFPELSRRLAPGARVYLESPDFPELAHGWRTLRQGRAGAV